MGSPYVGEIRLFAGNFAPLNWAFCNGQLMSIAENSVLFNLIGTTYGGDGISTFALPNLQCRVPIHMGTLAGGSTYVEGQLGGVETVTLTTGQMPAHNHVPSCSSSTTGSAAPTTGSYWASPTGTKQYTTNAPNATMANSMTLAGGNQPHDNMQPFLAVSFIISLFGIYPSQN